MAAAHRKSEEYKKIIIKRRKSEWLDIQDRYVNFAGEKVRSYS
jgi:hypothetical protein